jgi:hypothetical protein
MFVAAFSFAAVMREASSGLPKLKVGLMPSGSVDEEITSVAAQINAQAQTHAKDVTKEISKLLSASMDKFETTMQGLVTSCLGESLVAFPQTLKERGASTAEKQFAVTVQPTSSALSAEVTQKLQDASKDVALSHDKFYKRLSNEVIPAFLKELNKILAVEAALVLHKGKETSLVQITDAVEHNQVANADVVVDGACMWTAIASAIQDTLSKQEYSHELELYKILNSELALIKTMNLKIKQYVSRGLISSLLQATRKNSNAASDSTFERFTQGPLVYLKFHGA